MDFVIDIGILVTVIIALGEVFKRMEIGDAKYLPVLNIVLGIVGGIVYLTGDMKTNILMGIVIGLSASGLFDISKVFKK